MQVQLKVVLDTHNINDLSATILSFPHTGKLSMASRLKSFSWCQLLWRPNLQNVTIAVLHPSYYVTIGLVVSVSLGKVTKERREDRLRQNKWKWLAYWTVCNPSLGLQNPQKSWRMSEKFLRSFVCCCCCRFSQFRVDFNPSDWDSKFALVSFFRKINVSSQCQFTYAPAPHNSWISKL